MIASFQTFDKSPLGAFVQSPLKVRNTTGYNMVIHVVEDSVHYTFPPTFVDWPTDVDTWEDQTDAEDEDAIGFILVMPDSDVTRVADPPPAPPSDHPITPTSPFFEIILETWKGFYQDIVDVHGKPNTVSIVFGQTVPADVEVDAYDPGLQEFEDFLFDDEKVAECVLFYPEGRWLSFDQVYRNFSLSKIFPKLVADFDAAIFEERCRGFPGSWE